MRTAIMVLLVLAATACGSPSAVDTGGDTSQAAAGTPAAATGHGLTGMLGGDPTLEGGCVWLDTADGRVEVVWPDGWTATADPVGLSGPDGQTAAAGDEVRIEGRAATDRVSVCQVGTIWTATAVTIP